MSHIIRIAAAVCIIETFTCMSHIIRITAAVCIIETFTCMSHIIRITTAVCIIETFTCKAWRHIFTHSTVFIPALKLTKRKLLLHR